MLRCSIMHQSASYVNTSYQEVQPTVGYIYMIIHRIELCFYIPYARHYKPRLIFFFTQFSLQLRLILQTIYVLKTEILHFLSLKSAAYKWERLQIESGLWWRAYGSLIFIKPPLQNPFPLRLDVFYEWCLRSNNFAACWAYG